MLRTRALSYLFNSSCLALLFLSQLAHSQQIPVRNAEPRVGQQEVIMMRHAYLDEGRYQDWYEASASGVWPWFERLGARILGDFEIIYPEGDDATPGQDEALRFARYASFEHWQATRGSAQAGATGGSSRLAGNGPLSDGSSAGLATRRQYSQGSRGGLFLQGHMAETRPIYMPGLAERYEPTSGSPGAGAPIAVRLDRAQPGEQILALDYRRIRKGSFEEYHAIVRDRVWPYGEKIGARPVGQWRVAYLPNSVADESEGYDEVYSLVRYASWEHYQAVRDDPVAMGGNGPDWQDLVTAVERLNALTVETGPTEFLRGQPFGSPPQFTPGLNENYRRLP